MPLDGDALKIEEDDYCHFKDFKYVKKLMGGRELLNNQKRYVLWLVDVSEPEIYGNKLVAERVAQCKNNRLKMKDPNTKRLANTPTIFRDTNNPKDYIALPMVSSENRDYIPIAYLHDDVIPTNQIQTIPNASLYHFGIIESKFHMAWMRIVAGRLKSDYRYSKEIVYNNFPWPGVIKENINTPVEKVVSSEIKEKVENCAQDILATRDKYPDWSLAQLYDPDKMPLDLKNAHNQLDKAVENAYGVNFNGDEEKIVAHLFKLHNDIASNNNSLDSK